MRIVFMGTPAFGVPSLTALCEAGHQVVGVFPQPDRPRGRGNKLTASPVKEEALARGIPVYQPEKIRVESVEALRALKPELCVTAFDIRVPTTVRGREITNSGFTPAVPFSSSTTLSGTSSDEEQLLNATVPVSTIAANRASLTVFFILT